MNEDILLYVNRKRIEKERITRTSEMSAEMWAVPAVKSLTVKRKWKVKEKKKNKENRKPDKLGENWERRSRNNLESRKRE
jgi:hypothetical protein